ncbi:MAG: dTDP-4-dehydrorhamnose 3,5-epimerase [Geminicoccaceae bacterium]|nr:dTDP-4-dehydrorhamnose 3,5-epimerase [Geminicoccaceae bacterium]MCX7630806.1 dTDP-4-dehydrorhamnose 3,5-epimerase [Geminicoccaceae bacterium]MDW8126030.1 dTDP-4-dehydrorhamnose 3,5-epimerase [Geminicoccaceae bacterium]MDW8340884.1 dTDP-4-dehydrorhamnose 3,5-epimerase [Geminicoccaceae bacterium]
MQVIPAAIPEVRLVRPLRHTDPRGWFSEIWNRRAFREAGLDFDFVQDNLARSHAAGTLRGLHFQLPPAAQTKLVRVVSGRILDVAVDLRAGSPFFKRHVAVELSAEDGAWLLVPKGFAHGYLVLEPATEVLYKVDAPFDPAREAGISWNDPELAIPWPIREPILSERDRRLPRLRELLPLPFRYGEET